MSEPSSDQYGYNPETGEYREPPPPPKPRVEYPSRSSLRKQKAGSGRPEPAEPDPASAPSRAEAVTGPNPVFAPVIPPVVLPEAPVTAVAAASPGLHDTPAWPVPDHLPDDAMLSPQTGPLVLPPDVAGPMRRPMTGPVNRAPAGPAGRLSTASFRRPLNDAATGSITRPMAVPGLSVTRAERLEVVGPVQPLDAPGPVEADETGRIERPSSGFPGSPDTSLPAAFRAGGSLHTGVLDSPLDSPLDQPLDDPRLGPPPGPRLDPRHDEPDGARGRPDGAWSVSPIPRVVAAIVAVIGLVLVAGGILQGTLLKQPTTITASLADPPSQPIVVSAPGVLGLNGTRVQVTASTSSGRTVFVGIGRASDVMAYLGNVKRETVTGENGHGVLTAQNAGTEASLPDPGSVDVWKLSQRAKGAAGVSWPNVSGQYVVVAASDGKGSGPARLTFTWSGAQPHQFGAALIAVGAVFVICGLVLLIMLTSRARLERAG